MLIGIRETKRNQRDIDCINDILAFFEKKMCFIIGEIIK